jgi:NAD(P)-dependent dehydrogenase (short-subunit alcohol dehydrogenase family)
MGRVDGKCALVTGAGSGLGRSFAHLLAAEGARVAVTDIDAATAEETVDTIAAEHPGKARAWALDVTDEAAWQAVLAEVEKDFGGLNILINNAGIPGRGTVEDIDLETWRRVHGVDLDGVFLGCKYAIPVMRRAGGGSIVNISSIAGIVAAPNLAAYNSAKAAVRHFSKSVALHCAREGYAIRCNSVHPTFIRTPILEEYFERFGEEEAIAKLARQIPLGRIGEPEDVGYAILYLASDESRFITGTELLVDGGLSAM